MWTTTPSGLGKKCFPDILADVLGVCVGDQDVCAATESRSAYLVQLVLLKDLVAFHS
jgi:hypothetical protein